MSDDIASPPARGKPQFREGFAKISWNERKRRLYVLAWIATILAYLGLAFAYAWPQDYRDDTPILVMIGWAAFMVRTFIYHLGLLFLVIPIVSLWRRRWRLFVAAMPVLLIAVGPTWWQFRPRPKPTVPGGTMTVMTVNLLMANRRTGPIIDEIKAAQPDVLFLQEYTDHWREAIDAAVGQVYPHKVQVTREDSFGVAVYSRRPFKGRVEKHLDLGQCSVPQVRAVIDFDGRDVALYNLHLLPPKRLAITIETRAQFADLLELLSIETLPAIIAGDFNFTERSPQAAALSKTGVLDAQDAGGWGRGATWPVDGLLRRLPGVRIDHVYLTGGLTCVDCRAGVGQGSDHRPVVAEIGFGR